MDRKQEVAMSAMAFASVLIVLIVLLGLPGPARAQSVGELFRKVVPSVVVIRATGREVSTATGELVSFRETGSGVLVSDDGKLMTAAHVVHDKDEITVEFQNGETAAARVVASEPDADISLIQLERVPPGVAVARPGDSDTVRVGDQVVVVGAPYGLTYALSVGWISARWAPNTVYRAMPLAEFFQTDAVINTGNSGGPMFNMAGEAIGIVSHNISKSGGSEGLGFVVTMNTARELLLKMPAFWSGLTGQLLREAQADVLNVPGRVLGYLVKTVARNSPADALGLRGGTSSATIAGEPLVVGGDIMLSLDGIPVNGIGDLVKIRERLRRLQPGEEFTVVVLRSGRVLELAGRAP
jgi:S1-C subfamily serine protease